MIIKAPYPEFSEFIDLRSPDFSNTVTCQPDTFVTKIAQDGTFYTYSKTSPKTYSFSFSSRNFDLLDKLFKFILEFKEGRFQVEGLEDTPLVGAFTLNPTQITYPTRDEMGTIQGQFTGE